MSEYVPTLGEYAEIIALLSEHRPLPARLWRAEADALRRAELRRVVRIMSEFKPGQTR